MARNSPLVRALMLLGRADSADDRDVARALRRALKRAGQRAGDPQAVQVAGQPLDTGDYARWRERKLRRGAISTAPEVAPPRYALVLFALEPSTTTQFIRHGVGRHLTPPTVGDFEPAIEPKVALAGTLASWVEQFALPVARRRSSAPTGAGG